MNSAVPELHVVPGRLLLCRRRDLVPHSGVCVLMNEEQIALYYFPGDAVPLYAVSNWDPLGQANVLSRGIVGDLKGHLVIASPLYKHHYNLATGQCLEDETVRIRTYPVLLDGDQVFLLTS
ncbi:MAG: nitrite reductase small subunit NirD [Pseudohongiellaceae bacterium]